MKILIGCLFALLCLTGCSSSPEVRIAEAQAELAEHRADSVKDYRECLKRYEGKSSNSDPCAMYKEAAQVLAK